MDPFESSRTDWGGPLTLKAGPVTEVRSDHDHRDRRSSNPGPFEFGRVGILTGALSRIGTAVPNASHGVSIRPIIHEVDTHHLRKVDRTVQSRSPGRVVTTLVTSSRR